MIKKESFDNLKALAQTIKDNPQLGRIRVEGHTDSDGSDKSNLKLSDGRSKAVVEFLVTEGNVDRARLFGVGYGEGCPIGPNNSAEDKANNRRSEFVILEANEDANGKCRALKTAQEKTSSLPLDDNP